MLGIIFTTAYVIVCSLLLVVVLMQQGKGGDIAAAFGGSGSQTAFGARAGATVLTRATTVLGALFMVGSMALAITLALPLFQHNIRGVQRAQLRGELRVEPDYLLRDAIRVENAELGALCRAQFLVVLLLPAL